MNRAPRKIEIGVTLHEAPRSGKVYDQLAHGNAKAMDTTQRLPFVIAMPLKDRQSISIFLDGIHYRLNFSELIGATVAAHVKDDAYRADPNDGSALPRFLGVPFLPPKPPVDEEKARWDQSQN